MSSDDMEHREWYSIRGRMPLELRRRLAQHQRRVESSAGTRVGKSAILRGLLERGLDAAEAAEARQPVQTAQPYRLDVRAEEAEWRVWGVYASQRRAEGAVQVAHRWSGVTHWRVVHAQTGAELSRGTTDGA